MEDLSKFLGGATQYRVVNIIGNGMVQNAGSAYEAMLTNAPQGTVYTRTITAKSGMFCRMTYWDFYNRVDFHYIKIDGVYLYNNPSKPIRLNSSDNPSNDLVYNALFHSVFTTLEFKVVGNQTSSSYNRVNAGWCDVEEV